MELPEIKEINITDEFRQYVSLVDYIEKYKSDLKSPDLYHNVREVMSTFNYLKSEIRNQGLLIIDKKPHYKELFHILDCRLEDILLDVPILKEG